MKVVTRKDVINNVSKRWDLQYINIDVQKFKDIGDILRNEKPQTEYELCKIIGNRSWSENKCHQCWRDCEAVIQLGYDYEDGDDDKPTFICESCLESALSMIKK